MSLHEEYSDIVSPFESLDKEEVNGRFLMTVTLISIIKSKFYNPVSFFIEYLTNEGTQKLVNYITDSNKYQFTIDYIKTYPNVTKSRKVTNSLKKLNDSD